MRNDGLFHVCVLFKVIGVPDLALFVDVDVPGRELEAPGILPVPRELDAPADLQHLRPSGPSQHLFKVMVKEAAHQASARVPDAVPSV